MADRHYTFVPCSIEGCGKNVQAKGLCGKHYQQVRSNGLISPSVKDCKHCGTEFTAARHQAYCSDTCRYRARERRDGAVSRAEYRAKVRENAAFKFACEHCGKEAYRNLSGTNRKSGTGNRFCSMRCRKDGAAAKRTAEETAGMVYRSVVKPEIDALRRIARYVERPVTFAFNCIHCGTSMIVRRNGGLHKRVCDCCASATKKANAAISKAKRRAIERGAAADNINPIDVFERDKWKCQLCGIKTPKAKRGTYDDDAPELDHILPLSKGGNHAWSNVQCACRRCNGGKSNKPLGQFSFGFA